MMVACGPSASGRPVVLLGAGNLIAAYLLPRLVEAGFEVVAVARRDAVVPPGVRFERVDLGRDVTWTAPPGAALISVLPLALLAALLPRLAAARGIVAVGSTSLFSKADSDDPKESAKARQLGHAEDAVLAWRGADGGRATVLRPTLVYDGRGDRNVARMARVMRRYRVLPIAHPSDGLRQPIHADDVGRAILGAIDNPAAAGRAFNIAGAEVLTYRAMAERVFRAQGLRPRFVTLPVPWLRRAFGIAAGLGIVRETGFGSAVFARMNQDLVFDVSEGLAVLGYAPRPFDPAPRA